MIKLKELLTLRGMVYSEEIKPKHWVIENVVGAQEYFNPILGKPTQIIESFCLWG